MFRTNLKDQPLEYLEALLESIKAEISYRKAVEPRRLSRCSACGHTGHNVMTCGSQRYPQDGQLHPFPTRRSKKKCGCGRSNCPNPKED